MEMHMCGQVTGVITSILALLTLPGLATVTAYMFVQFSGAFESFIACHAYLISNLAMAEPM